MKQLIQLDRLAALSAKITDSRTTARCLLVIGYILQRVVEHTTRCIIILTTSCRLHGTSTTAFHSAVA